MPHFGYPDMRATNDALAGMSAKTGARLVATNDAHYIRQDDATAQDILVSVRKQGYALNDQELEIGLRSIAVPVRNPVGEVVAAMNVGAQASRVSMRQMIDTFLPVLKVPGAVYQLDTTPN